MCSWKVEYCLIRLIDRRNAGAIKRQSDFDPAAKVGEGFYGNCGPKRAGAFLNSEWAPGAAVELRPFEPAREPESAAVVVDEQNQLAGVNAQTDHHVAGAAVPAN